MSSTLQRLPRLWGDIEVTQPNLSAAPSPRPVGYAQSCPGVPLLALSSAFPRASTGRSMMLVLLLFHPPLTPVNRNLAGVR